MIQDIINRVKENNMQDKNFIDVLIKIKSMKQAQDVIERISGNTIDKMIADEINYEIHRKAFEKALNERALDYASK